MRYKPLTRDYLPRGPELDYSKNGETPYRSSAYSKPIYAEMGKQEYKTN